MKVKCVATLGKDLSPNALIVSGFNTTDFQLGIGIIYVVYSMALYNGILHYLTFDRWNTLPSWFPAELFSVENPLLPLNWYFAFYNPPTPSGLEALWGYDEMVHIPDHHDNLIERDKNAVKIFLERKSEIDYWLSK